MSQDDDATIERVARAMVTADNGDPEQIIYRRTGPDSFEPLGSAWELFKPKARTAITAYLSALPERELLAEAEDDAVRLHKLATDRFEEIIVLKTRLAEALEALEPFAESLVAQTDVTHHSQDWREETDNTVVSIKTSHQRKGMPDLSPDHTLWVGAFRRARAAADKIRAALTQEKSP